MTLTMEELVTRMTKPVIADISLQVLQQLYEQHLLPYMFTYELENHDPVKLHFEKDNFSHLLGLEKMVEGKVGNLAQYRGLEGWKNIKNGTINREHMRSRAGKPNFNSLKGKWIYFLALPRILTSDTSMIKFNKLGAELLIYGSFDNAIVHLGISKRRETELKTWCPRTILEEGKTPPRYGTKHIDGQPSLRVVSIKRAIK
ncbi:PBECR4 domain-containing protein [Paenibacillus sp. FSL H8-0104]|uniref:PBECR4 domain-containing protein n=1 Tax=Paenibacillus sp. FSL H8-0104 TaxID=2954509 RepID=UPI0030FD8BF8